jgi:hypothetical protein
VVAELVLALREHSDGEYRELALAWIKRGFEADPTSQFREAFERVWTVRERSVEVDWVGGDEYTRRPF